MMRVQKMPMTAPVSLPPIIVHRLSIVPRFALILPYRRFAMLQRDDFLWVREIYEVLPRSSSSAYVRLRYGRAQKWSEIAWPRAIVRPSPGRHAADTMDVKLSRYSLQVESVQTMRLHSVSDDDALDAGARREGSGFVSALAETDMFLPFDTARGAAVHLWQGTFGAGCGEENPEVQLVRVRPWCKPVTRLVSGLGSGGAL